MYESPIQEVFSGIHIDTLKDAADAYIVRAVQKMDIEVDRDELIRALQYDRDQYLKGYTDGLAFKQQVKTRADKIRAMTDAELAEWLDTITVKAQAYGYECADSCPNDCPLPEDWLLWLKEGVTE